MKVKDLSIQEVLTFAYCSMQYHLRFRHGLTWYPASPRAAMSAVVRETVRELFRLQLTAKGRKRAGPSSMTILNEGANLVASHYPEAADYAERSRRDMTFALASVHKQQYSFPRDRMIGFDIPYEAILELKVGKGLRVKGSIDAAFFRNVDTSFEQVVCVSVASAHDPHEDLVRYGGLRRGFAHLAVKRGLGITGAPVRHKVLPVLRRVRSKTDKLVEEAPNTEQVSPKDAVSFRQTVAQAHLGIEAEFAIPTGDSDKCNHCPYASICHQSLAVRDPTQGERDAIESGAQASPFGDWFKGGRA